MISAALLRKFPLDSRFFGPPRHETNCAGYGYSRALRTQQVRPTEILPTAKPTWYGPTVAGHIPAVNVGDARPPLCVFTLQNGRVLGPDAHPVAPGDYLLTDSAWSLPPRSAEFTHRPIMRRRRRYPSVRLTGRVALLGACWAGGSFAHFSSDALPRWKLIEEAGFHLRDFNHVLAYDPRTRSSEVLLATLKLAPKLIRAQALCDYTCDELVFTSHPHFTPRYTPDLLRFVRELLPARSGERRVYLSRSGYARHPSNAAALEALLARKGFETVPADDHLAALHACQEASIVLGVEGSNLYNTIFCRPGSRVILLLWQGCPFSYIAGIGAALGHHTSIVPATAGSSDAAPHFALEAVEAAVTEAIQAAA